MFAKNKLMLKYSDVDKDPTIIVNNTCWLATASNMLSAAGYGKNTTIYKTLIQNAPKIYAETNFYFPIVQKLVQAVCFETAMNGYVHSALKFYIKNHPESLKLQHVRVYGTFSAVPLSDPDLLKILSSCLKKGYMIGLSLGHYDALNHYIITNYAHAITLWDVTDNQITITDSDDEYDKPEDNVEKDLKKYTLNYNSDNGAWMISVPGKVPIFIKNVTILGDSDIDNVIPSSLKKSQFVIKNSSICCL